MKNYNTTDLDPEAAFERHVFHRDYFAHYLRWSHILNQVKLGDRLCDFGCGKGNLLEVLYRNKRKCAMYLGIDIRKQTIEKAKEKFNMVKWAMWLPLDLIKDSFNYHLIQADRVCSFEVLEHVGKQNVPIFLEHFKLCGKRDATYYLSTPNYSETVGAAGNHTYDSGDGRGVAVHEWTWQDLQEQIVMAGFEVVNMYGTFASIKDYVNEMEPPVREVFEHLRMYYDVDFLATVFAPLFPHQARNIMWVLKQV